MLKLLLLYRCYINIFWWGLVWAFWGRCCWEGWGQHLAFWKRFLKVLLLFVAVCCGLRSGWDSNLTVTDRTLVELQLVFWCSFLMVSWFEKSASKFLQLRFMGGFLFVWFFHRFYSSLLASDRTLWVIAVWCSIILQVFISLGLSMTCFLCLCSFNATAASVHIRDVQGGLHLGLAEFPWFSHSFYSSLTKKAITKPFFSKFPIIPMQCFKNIYSAQTITQWKVSKVGTAIEKSTILSKIHLSDLE